MSNGIQAVTTDAAPTTHLPVALVELRATVRAFVLRRVRDSALADDLTQETLLRLSRHRGSIRVSERLEAWIYRVARNVIADHFRAARPAEVFDETVHSAGADEEGARSVLALEAQRLSAGLARYVRSVVEGLPPIYREALEATEFAGETQVDYARRLGLSLSAAKSRVQRARAMVREEMERCCRFEFDRYGTAVTVRSKQCGCDIELCADEPQDRAAR